MKQNILASLITLLFIGSSAYAQTNSSDRFYSKYKVTITNLTRGQTLSPPVLATHNPRFEIFQLGKPASPGIYKMAEDGVTEVLAQEIKNGASPKDIVISPGPIPPGESRSFELKAGWYSALSFATMLVTTNDGFTGVSGIDLPSMSASFYLPAYDAGSETNNESCKFVPGPPCSAEMVRAPQGAEGYVHVHRGIQGVGDLPKEKFDWRNPVVYVTIQRK